MLNVSRLSHHHHVVYETGVVAMLEAANIVLAVLANLDIAV